MENAREAIKEVVSAVTPGLAELLDAYCLSKHGKDAATLFLTNLQKLLECLTELYGNEETAQIILKIILKRHSML